VPTFRLADVAPLPKGRFAEVTVPPTTRATPTARARGSGSRSPPQADTAGVGIRRDNPAGTPRSRSPTPQFPSRLILPVVPGVGVPTALPPCPGLRGEPCRAYSPTRTRPPRSSNLFRPLSAAAVTIEPLRHGRRRPIAEAPPVPEPPEATTADPAADAVRPVSMPFIDRLASAVVTGAPPILVLLELWLGWNNGVLVWQDLLILAIFLHGDRLRHHGRLPPAIHAPQLQVRPRDAFIFAALGSAAAEGPVIDWWPRTASTISSPDEAGDPHSPHLDDRHGWRGELWASCTLTSDGCSATWMWLTRIATPRTCSPTADQVRRPHLHPLGGGRGGGGVRSRRRADRHRGGRPDRDAVGGAARIFFMHHSTFSINSVCHYFGRHDYDTGDESRNVSGSRFRLGASPGTTTTTPFHLVSPRTPPVAAGPSAGIIRLLEMTGLAWDVCG